MSGLINLSTPPRLDVLSFPLRGSRLIEASAGTGKTYTIAALYLRLVLGHGGDASFLRPLTPPEILVVTFTDAATKELRDRIRARLTEAADAFRAAVDEPAEDALLQALRASYPVVDWPRCAHRLQLAAEWIDEAAVSTIHGWCNRMLREHAFDSGSLFTQKLETDQSELFAEAVRDYWRSHCYLLTPAQASQMAKWWNGPEALQHELKKLSRHTALLSAGCAPQTALVQAAAERERQLASLKAPWPGWLDEVRTILDKAVDSKQVDGRKLQRRYYSDWLEALGEWAAGATDWPELSETAWLRLSTDGLNEIWKGGSPPEHPAFAAVAALPELLRQLPNARPDILCHASAWVALRFTAEQTRRAEIGFDDLLTRLDTALDGPGGLRLAELIRRQFPVALIDEFQDTDPVQYRIFDRVYEIAANRADVATILIGDPKQAIYGFRGADIHTYLQVRVATDGRHYTLGTNFRSTHAMVSAVNRMFHQAEERAEGAGAFLFRDAVGNNPLPFDAVAAKGRSQHFVIDGERSAALRCWYVESEDAGNKDACVRRLAEASAAEIARLLTLGQKGRAGFEGSDGELRPVQSGDFAVLVNTGREASAVLSALTRLGVRSVYLSDQESVYQSAQALELWSWLGACAAPEDGCLLRAALATASLGLGWDDLEHLNHDEIAWEARVLQFRDYRQCWRRQGVLPMLHRLLHDFSVPRRLIAAGNERALTDVLHLAELLQQASALIDGEHALIRHLVEQLEDAGQQGDERKVRLESDTELVKVVTVHKSKGLEYPLVFLPFPWACRVLKVDDLPLQWHGDDGRLRLALEPDEDARKLSDRERLAEDLRKFYVALTRAQHVTWVGYANPESGKTPIELSAPGYLLASGASLAGSLAEALEMQRANSVDIVVESRPTGISSRYVSDGEARTFTVRGPLQLPRHPHWWIASYSAMQQVESVDGGLAMQPAKVATTAAEDIYVESHEADDTAKVDKALTVSALVGLHGFPRGAEAGSFLHGLFEWAATAGFGRVVERPEPLNDQIARRCVLRGWDRWINTLTSWLPAYLAEPFPLHGATPFRLSTLVTYKAELEFWFAVDGASTQRLDELVTTHTLGGVVRPRIAPKQLNGMLKGYIDLVFEHEGRYYVADYKSNSLGAGDDAYSAEALRDSVLKHRYELQYVLYVFALHRLLKSRLVDYDYERHVGGAVYLYLRGTAATSRGLHFERPPQVLIEALDSLFSAGSTAEVQG